MTDVEAVTFREMATALHELGYSEQEMADTELTARRLVRAGWTEASAEMAVIRMRRRNEVLDNARRLLLRAGYLELLIRELIERDPPRWRLIWRLVCAIVSARWRRVRG